MKISIAWIFDHINANWRDHDVTQLVNLFNQKTAEIEAFYPIKIDIEQLFLGKVISVAQETVELHIQETDQVIELPKRENIQVDQLFLVKCKGQEWRWAVGKDFRYEKGDTLPALYVDQKDIAGGWKREIEVDDYILEVDNKSITHRPDLWSHYGFAREVAILLDLPLKDMSHMLLEVPIKTYVAESKADADQPYAVRIGEPALIKRFAIAYFSAIENRPSLPWMLSRLCRIDAKPIDALVDMTNYVMFDIGQPLHAFDAQKIETKVIEPRLAKQGEIIALLDGDTVELASQDIVVTDGVQPIALAGIMGGRDTAISSNTHTVLLEAANFDATTIRLSTTRHKKRTESSARFEKTVDPNQNIIGIERFLKLLQNAQIPYSASAIVSAGPATQPLDIVIEHNYMQERLGVEIDSNKVVAIFNALGCTVKLNRSADDISYVVTVPTVRSTKDIKIKEDLLEEIGRLYGYTNVPFLLPRKETKPSDLHRLYRQRDIKQLLSFGFAMHEVKNYAFFNESFLQALQWRPEDTVSIESPISEQYQTLATSLVPGLLANVHENHAEHDKLNFFEWARSWHKNGSEIIERSELAGIFYNKKEAISFYDIKAKMQHLFNMIHLPVEWHKLNEPLDPWFAPYQTAHIKHGDTVIGTIGIVDVGFIHHLITGHMGLFVIDGTFLNEFKEVQKVFHPIVKYPAVDRDISMMISRQITVKQITDCIAACSSLITDVRLVDFFEKPEWGDQRSVAFRFVMQDDKKTLTHQEVDAIGLLVNKAVQTLGAQIR